MNGAQVKKKKEKLLSCAHVLDETSILVLLRCCFGQDGKEIQQNLKPTRRGITYAHTNNFYGVRVVVAVRWSSLLKLPNRSQGT